MQTWMRKCSSKPSTVLTLLWRNSTLRRTLLPTSRRNSTRNTTLPGTVLWEGTLVPMLLTRQSTLFTSISDKLQCFCSNPAECLILHLPYFANFHHKKKMSSSISQCFNLVYRSFIWWYQKHCYQFRSLNNYSSNYKGKLKFSQKDRIFFIYFL